MDVKIRGYEGHISSQKVEEVMKALYNVARAIGKLETGVDAPESNAIKQILLHTHNPNALKISSDVVASIVGIRLPQTSNNSFMSAQEICDALFESGWKEKLQSDQEKFSLKDDEVRAIIKAALPKIRITFSMPMDMRDKNSFIYEQSLSRRRNSRLNDLMTVHTEDTDLNLGGVEAAIKQAKREAGWRAYCENRDESIRHAI